MRILYDGTVYVEQATGGINRYFNNLIHELPPDFKPIFTTCGVKSLNHPQHAQLKTFLYQSFRPGRISIRLQRQYFRFISTLCRPQLIHPTYYSLLTEFSFFQVKVPIVLTVWDFIHEIFSDDIDPQGNFAEQKRQAILGSQAIICISEHTKRDLLDRFPIAEARVHVTPLATDLSLRYAYGDEHTPDQPYFLYVGGRNSYKNFRQFVSAFAKLLPDKLDLKLCVVGAPFNQQEQSWLDELNIRASVEHYGYASDTHLAKLYRCSTALVYPSLYEGFGIPPLEALACGTVAIACNSSSLPEVVGNAGILVDTAKVDELVDAMQFVLDHPAERDRLITAGLQQAKQFSWEKTAQQTVEVYRSLL